MYKADDPDEARAADDHAVLWNLETEKRLYEGRHPRFNDDAVTRLTVRLCRKYIGGDIMDAGAGMAGPMRLFPRAIGLDLAPRQPRTVGGDLCRMPFRSGAFDTVFSIEVLEHLNGDQLPQGLAEISRVLRRGGHAILVTPYNEPIARRMTICPNCGTKFHWLGHVRAFDEHSMSAAVQSAGLEVVEWKVRHLAFEGEHRLLGRFTFLLSSMGIALPQTLIVIARKTA